MKLSFNLFFALSGLTAVYASNAHRGSDNEQVSRFCRDANRLSVELTVER